MIMLIIMFFLVESIIVFFYLKGLPKKSQAKQKIYLSLTKINLQAIFALPRQKHSLKLRGLT